MVYKMKHILLIGLFIYVSHIFAQLRSENLDENEQQTILNDNPYETNKPTNIEPDLDAEDYPIVESFGETTFGNDTELFDVINKVVTKVLGNDTYIMHKVDNTTFNGSEPVIEITIKLKIGDTSSNEFKVVNYEVLSKSQLNASTETRKSFTQAGYTHNPDTCKLYNENLEKLWYNLSKYINLTEKPNQRGLHNIALMLDAYLQHVNPPKDNSKAVVSLKVHQRPDDKISKTIQKINKMLDDKTANALRIQFMVLKELKPNYSDINNTDCKIINEDALASSIDLSYRNYLENSDCQDDRNTRISKEHMLHHQGKRVHFKKHKALNNNDKKNKLYRDSYLENRFVDRLNADENTFIDTPVESRTFLAHPIIHEFRKLTPISNEECQRFALRKFLTTLRSVLERFMALLDCSVDNTERSEGDNFIFAATSSDSKVRKNSLNEAKSKEVYLSAKINENVNKIMQSKDSYFGNAWQASNKILDDNHIENNNNYNSKVHGIEYTNNESILSHQPNKVENIQITGFGNNLTRVQNDLFKNHKINDENKQIRNKSILSLLPFYEEYNQYLKHKYNTPLNILDTTYVAEATNEGNNKSETHKLTKHDENINETIEIDTMSRKLEAKSVMYSDIVTTELTKPFINEQHYLKSVSSTTNDDKNNVVVNLEYHENINPYYDNYFEELKEDSPQYNKKSKGEKESDDYVELTHLVKHPKMLVYRPQIIIKHILPFKKFLDVVNLPNFNTKEMQLLKILRYYPNNTVKTMYETHNLEKKLAPLEVRSDLIHRDSLTRRNNKKNDNIDLKEIAFNLLKKYREKIVTHDAINSNETNLYTNTDNVDDQDNNKNSQIDNYNKLTENKTNYDELSEKIIIEPDIKTKGTDSIDGIILNNDSLTDLMKWWHIITKNMSFMVKDIGI